MAYQCCSGAATMANEPDTGHFGGESKDTVREPLHLASLQPGFSRDIKSTAAWTSTPEILFNSSGWSLSSDKFQISPDDVSVQTRLRTSGLLSGGVEEGRMMPNPELIHSMLELHSLLLLLSI